MNHAGFMEGGRGREGEGGGGEVGGGGEIGGRRGGGRRGGEGAERGIRMNHRAFSWGAESFTLLQHTVHGVLDGGNVVLLLPVFHYLANLISWRR